MLRHFGVTPYMVFDGDYLPSKAATEDSRAKSRAERQKAAQALLNAGKTAQATQEFQKCIDITPEMASALIQQLKKMDIPYVVAPYEADAQLVYLEREGLIHGIISDDSDLLVFGAKKLLTKLDGYGNCIEINRKDFCACREVSLTGWSDIEFRRMAIMSGCDYLKGLPGVGLKTAYRKIRKTKSPERIVKMIQLEGKRVDENYLTQFYQAELTFLHQWVFCPTRKELVHLTELDGSRTAEEMPYIGAFVEPEAARGVAAGNLNPMTKLPIVLPLTPSKRRHSQTTTPTSSSHQPPKPINSYFRKPGHSRIPMGNMEANCFTVDPQKIAQITHGGLVPRVFPLPRPYISHEPLPSPGDGRLPISSISQNSTRPQRRRTEPIADMLTRLSTPRRPGGTVNNPTPQQSRSESAPRPQKKPRLCEATDDTSPKNSKFFKIPEPTKSPSKGKSEGYLLSDDSIEMALANLPDIDGFKSPAKSRASIAIFDDSTLESPSQEPTQETQQASEGATQATSQNTDPSSLSSQNTEVGVHSFSKPTPTTAAKSLRTPFGSQLDRFTYSSSSSSRSSRSGIDSIFSNPPTASTSTPPTGLSSRLTPLQRLGAKALNSPISPRVTKPRASLPFIKPIPGIPVNPSFVPLPKVDLKEVEALSRPCGSEDLIVHDSEGEEDEFVENDDEAATLPKLNLSRFAFG